MIHSWKVTQVQPPKGFSISSMYRCACVWSLWVHTCMYTCAVRGQLQASLLRLCLPVLLLLFGVRVSLQPGTHPMHYAVYPPSPGDPTLSAALVTTHGFSFLVFSTLVLEMVLESSRLQDKPFGNRAISLALKSFKNSFQCHCNGIFL